MTQLLSREGALSRWDEVLVDDRGKIEGCVPTHLHAGGIVFDDLWLSVDTVSSPANGREHRQRLLRPPKFVLSVKDVCGGVRASGMVN